MNDENAKDLNELIEKLVSDVTRMTKENVEDGDVTLEELEEELEEMVNDMIHDEYVGDLVAIIISEVKFRVAKKE